MSQEILRKKLESIQTLVGECLEELGQPMGHSPGNPKAAPAAPSATKDMVLQIANKVSDCDETEKINKEILDKSKPGPEEKILLCLYIAFKYFGNGWLTTGQIEKITSELGVKIDHGNASNKMKELRKFVESGSARAPGQPTPYRLNRNGIKRFEEIINPKHAVGDD